MQALEAGDPRWIGRYRLLKRLGAGGMGLVYLGEGRHGALVAVKVVHAGLAHDEQFRLRFVREVAVGRQVSGPWTAAIVDADPSAPTPWLATEYVPGPSLDDAVRTAGPLPRTAVHIVAAGLAAALAAIHGAGLVHRDVKPSNVLLAADGPRLIDFGISRAIDGTRITSTGLVVGTPAFMSPEQADGAEVGPESDVFSLGAVLVLAATEVGPFGDSAPLVILRRIATDEPDLGSLAEPVRGIVAACLRRDRTDRPSAAELVQLLQPVPAIGPGWLPPTVSQLTAEPPAPTRPDPPEPAPTRVAAPAPVPPRRLPRRAFLAGAGALGLAAAGVGGYALWNRPSRSLWTFRLTTQESDLTAGPAAGKVAALASAAGAVYVSTDDGLDSRRHRVLALEPTTGEPVWTHEEAHPGRTLAAFGDRLVGSDGFNAVYGLRTTAVGRLWSGLGALLGVADGCVVTSGSGVITWESSLNGFDMATGELRWARAITVEDSVSYRTTPGVTSPGGLHLCTDQRIDTIDVATGAVRWSRPWGVPQPRRSMTAVGDVLYVAEAGWGAGHVLALDAASGAPRWQQDVDGLVALVADGDGAYYVGASGLVRAWDAAGRERWTWPLAERLEPGGSSSVDARSAVAVAGGSIVVVFEMSTYEDLTYTVVPGLARLTDGALEWRQDLDDTVEIGERLVGPVATDGAVILGIGDSVHAVASV